MDPVEKIIWTERSLASLESIAAFISRDSIYYSSQLVKRIIHSVEKLQLFPQSGRIVPEFNDANIREILIQNYRIVYTMKGHILYVLLVSHGMQLLPNDIRDNSG